MLLRPFLILCWLSKRSGLVFWHSIGDIYTMAQCRSNRHFPNASPAALQGEIIQIPKSEASFFLSVFIPQAFIFCYGRIIILFFCSDCAWCFVALKIVLFFLVPFFGRDSNETILSMSNDCLAFAIEPGLPTSQFLSFSNNCEQYHM